MAYNPYTGAIPTNTPNPYSGGAPGGGGAYGGIPNLPASTTNTNQTIGTNAYPQLMAILGSGYQGGLNSEMANIGNLLKGQIPGDVMNQIGQAGAERGIATGSPGSPNANAAMMRALGLTSLGLQQTGMQDLTQAISQVPIQQNQTSYDTTDLSAARAQYAAAPDPYLAAQQALQNAQAGISQGRSSVPSVTGAGSGGSGGQSLASQNPGQFDPGLGGVYPSQGTGSAPSAGGYSPYAYSPPSSYVPGYQQYPTSGFEGDDIWGGIDPYDPTTWGAYGMGDQGGESFPGGQSLYPQSQYGLPTWQDTSSTMGYNPYEFNDMFGLGNDGGYLSTDSPPVDYGAYDDYSWIFNDGYGE